MLQAICLLFLLVHPAHHVQILTNLLLRPDSFLVLPHQPVHSLAHPVLQLILEVSLHIHNHSVDVLSNPLVLGGDSIHDLSVLDLLFLCVLNINLPRGLISWTRHSEGGSLACLRISSERHCRWMYAEI